MSDAGRSLPVTASWDDEAYVWVAESADVPGLVTEAPTIDRLVEKLQAMIPELLELNGGRSGQEEVSFWIKPGASPAHRILTADLAPWLMRLYAKWAATSCGKVKAITRFDSARYESSRDRGR